jgi:nitroimidazol reductase NimA-like FMN-containing flavoprotein (pyridoxamine 5'-phosphate oxidase superfamily)
VRLKKAVANLLGLERVCRVATAGESGIHVVPVCQVLEGGRIYFGSGRDAAKVRHLQKDPRIAVVVDLYSEDWDSLKGAMIQGTAKLIRGGPQFRKIRALLYKKYPQYPAASAIEESDSVIVEVTPVRLSDWGTE